MIREIHAKNPQKIAFLIRIMFIATGLKEYVLAYLNNPFSVYVIAGIFVRGIFNLQYVVIGVQFGKLEDYLNDNRTWYDKSNFERVSFILMSGLVVLSMLAIPWVGRLFN